MRVVVYPHRMELGGSQVNAIELAGAVRDLGHDVVVFGQPGSLVDRVRAMGLEFVAAPRPRGRPSPWVMRALNRLVAARGAGVVHGYEWTAALEAYWGPRACHGVPALATVMSMAVAPFLPYDMPLVVGTAQIAAHERRAGRADVALIEPPIDTALNAPGAAGAAAFAARHGLDPDAVTLVCVTRLAGELKLEGVLAAIDCAGETAPRAAVQLVLVGDGPHRDAVAARAAQANARAGRRAVVLTGALADPRPAYAAADVCLGMGGSALRAMAFGKPVVVQGEQGFWELLTPRAVEQFLWTGWYGVGDGPQHGPARLRAALGEVVGRPDRRAELGAYARRLVEQRFSLRAAGRRQVELYERAVADAPPRGRPWAAAAARRSAAGLAAYRVRSRVDRLRGCAAAEDFNSRPVAGLPPPGAGAAA